MSTSITLFPTTKAVAAVPAGSILVEDFENVATKWKPTQGKATIVSSTNHTEGESSMAVTYDVTAGDAIISTATTPEPFPSDKIYSSLQVDLKGDGTWNTVYALLTDQSGEVYYFRVDAMGYTTWKTVKVDLTRAPTAVSHGNKNSVLDAPLTLTRLIVVRNGTQPAKGTFNIDNIQAGGDNWSKPVAENPDKAKNFVPSIGQTTTVSFNAGTPGDYILELKDPTGLTKTFQGSTAIPNKISVKWDGKSNDGSSRLAGNVNAVVKYDITPNSSVAAPVVSGGSAFLTGIAARKKSSTDVLTGVNGSLVNVDMVSANNQAKLMEDAYINYDRESFEWNLIEPSKGYFQWAQFDQTVATANARNINIIGRLLYSANWASSAPAGTSAADVPYYPPTSLKDYTDYVTATVTRYKDSVHTWEVWNEVNTPLYWKPAPDPAAYAEMMKATQAAIKAADPTATIIAGGLAGFDYTYMEKFRAAGGMTTFDGIGVHTFVNGQFDASMTAAWLDGAEAYLSKYAPKAKIWITELAWSTCSATASSCDSPVTEEQQAQYLQQAYLDAAQRGVKAITWWNLIEFGTSGNRLDNYGLVEKTGRVKPGYNALQTVGKALYGSVVVGEAAPTDDGKSVLLNPMDTVAGWKAYALKEGTVTLANTTLRHGTAGGAAVTYNFSGASIGAELQTSIKVPGEPKALSLWAYGDKTSNPIYMKFQDASGEYFQALVGHSAAPKWKRMTVYLDGINSNYTHFGGNNDGVVNYPITVTSVFIYKSTITKQAVGQVFIDDITAHYGQVTRGVVLSGNGVQTQAVYNHDNSTVKLAVPSNDVRIMKNADSITTVPVVSGVATVAVTEKPVYALYPMGASAESSKVGLPVSFTWQSADRAKVAIQVYAKNGAFVKTIKGTTEYDSGLKVETWDGKKSDNTVASAGDYKFRITFYDVNGQTSFIEKVFTKTV